MLCLASLDPLDATAERGERNICTYAYIYMLTSNILEDLAKT